MKWLAVLLAAAVTTAILVACGKVYLNATGGADPNVVITTQSTLTNELWAHYRFDEDGGSIVHDSAPQKRDGVLLGGMWLVDGGEFGGALHFDGADSGVIVNGFPDAPLDFSVSMWIRAAAPPPAASYMNNMQLTSGFGTILSTEVVHQGGWQFNLEPSDDGGIATHFAFWQPGQTMSYHPLAIVRCTCIVPNQWTHVVAILDSSTDTLALYANGTLAAPPFTNAQTISPGAVALYIGTWGGNGPPRFLVGDIDDVAIYGRALTPTEVMELESNPPPDVP
jgi:hypothetical protein